MKFSYKLPKSKIIKDRFEYLASIATNKSVLHVGCVDRGLLDQKIGTDKFLHHILDRRSKDITGIDIDLQGINKMREYGYKNVICADIEQWESDKKYEVIILGEIIEHIDNCGAFLNSIKKNSDKDTLLVFTTPNAYYYLFWIFNLFKLENIHPDHNYMFSFFSLKQLFEKFNLEIVDFMFVWEKANFVKNSDDSKAKLFKQVFNFLFNIPYYFRFLFPQFGKGLIINAKLKKEE